MTSTDQEISLQLTPFPADSNYILLFWGDVGPLISLGVLHQHLLCLFTDLEQEGEVIPSDMPGFPLVNSESVLQFGVMAITWLPVVLASWPI